MTHLHLHTYYSLLDAITKPEELAKKLKEMGHTAAAVTDHGNLYGAVEITNVFAKYGIKAITGCEMYICDDVNIKDKNSKYYHLILLCKDNQGRLNLNKLVSESTQHKYYGKPRIDFSMLEKYHEGLICTSACMAGEISRHIMADEINDAERIALKYKELFGEDFYIEYQAHEDETQQILNAKLVALAIKLNIPYVVTCDSHYLNKDDQKYHSIFVNIGSTREVGETYNDCYVQSEEEILEKCISTQKYNHIALANTDKIANMCVNTIPLSAPIMPHVTIPNDYPSEIEYLKHLCRRGFIDKGFAKWDLTEWKNYLSEVVYIEGEPTTREIIHFDTVQEIREKYYERIRYELNAIQKMGFEGYYLLVHSYVSCVKRRGIARGSAGGSIIAYLAGIVDIDPIKYGLYFERFIDVGALPLLEQGKITPKQLKIPDVDTDFAPSERDTAIDFITKKYGEDNVIALGQFSYIWAKGALKDIGRVLGIPFEITNEITKSLDQETIDDIFEQDLLKEYRSQYPKLFEYASKLAGLPKSFGAHPCGLCITQQIADTYNATEFDEDKGKWVLQGDMHTADDLGLVKCDFLGLRTLDVIYDVLDIIGENYNYIAPHKINTSDMEVWNEFAKGNTECIFQFESDGMKQMLSDMKCNCIENLSAANALYRPGAKAFIPNYINRKNGTEEITYLHPDLEPILKNSYGIILFQEQLIEIGKLANLPNPDELRKATAKKKPELMAKIEPLLKDGLKNRGWGQEQVDKLWETILDFARYSFNKSHSSAYALTAYISMFLKVHHPVEFITACINSYEGDINGIVKTINEGKRMGIKFKFDTWRDILSTTTCKDGVVYLGLNTIKGFGNSQAEALHRLSEKSKKFLDFLTNAKEEKKDLSGTNIATLIKHDFFEEFGDSDKLLTIYNIFNLVDGRKVFQKGKELPISEDIIKKFSKETSKQYRDIDVMGLLFYLIEKTPTRKQTLGAKLNSELKDFGYIRYQDTTQPHTYYILDVNTKYAPKITLYTISKGVTFVAKMSKKDFSQHPICVGNLVSADFAIKPKMTLNPDKESPNKFMPIPNTREYWIKNIKIIQ